MKTTIEELFDSMTILYENIYNLLKGFQEATVSERNDITVPIKSLTGVVEQVKINSFQKLQNELARLDSNFKSLINSDNLSYVVNADGSISQVARTSFINAEYLNNFKIDSNCIVDKKTFINDLIYPNVKIPITLADKKLLSDVQCTMFDVAFGYDKLKNGETSLLDIKYLISTGEVEATETLRTLQVEKDKVQYFGKFTVISSDAVDNKFNIILSDIKYSSLNSIGKSIDLKVGDMLVSKSGAAKFKIDEIDKFSKKLAVTRIAGTDTIKIGIDELYFNEILDDDSSIVGIPVQPNKQLAVFLSTENFKNIGYPSMAILLDTNTYKVDYDGATYTLDEFFSKFVTNFSEYLNSLIKETSIPASLAVKPKKPSLDSTNFKVVQINKHLTANKSNAELKELNENKQRIQNEIEYKQNQIDLTQNEIDTLKYKSAEEKANRINTIKDLRNEINTLQGNLLTITRDLDNNAIEYGLKSYKPKYRVIGIWDMQDPIYSPLTKPQTIIKYEVQYRYLSKDVDTVENTSLKMITNGKEVNVAFSSWNDLPTRTLNKVTDINGNLIWETPVLDSIDDININQCAISIREGESIEIKVRAVTEAGYPISPAKSEWSDILRVDFPNDLKDSNISTLVAKNEDDLRLAELNNILQKSGVMGHIANQIKESEKTFHHHARDIASGFYTSEQKNIDLSTWLIDLKKELDALKSISDENLLSIELIDFKNETFSVKNNTTMELFAGNYADSLNLMDNKKWGSIIRKQGFIKIKNKSNIPLEIKSLVPGVNFSSTVAPSYYNVPIRNVGSLIQSSKQIIYFRNIDITGQNEEIFKLVKPKLEPTPTQPKDAYIDKLAIEADKNIIYYDANDLNVKICKLKDNTGTDFIAYTKEHPSYNSENKNLMRSEFDRLKLYTANIKAQQYQSESLSTDTVGLGFDNNDFYAIGENSCGAFLYPLIANQATVTVVGNTTVSTLIVQKDSEILIPIIFEFRMMDRLGRVNGLNDTTINDSITYSKKLGVDLLINNEIFKFDINVTAKLKSKVQPIESLNVSSIVSSFTNESKEVII